VSKRRASTLGAVFSFFVILPNFDLKDMILTNTKDFPWKNGPNSPNFEILKFIA
jgi:hypothetical protein